MHSAQRCIARTIAQRPALHCAQRFTASAVQCATLYTPPPLSGGSRAQRKFAGEAERSGKRGYCEAFNESTASAATTRNASQGVRACICFQRSAYTARTATQRTALHSAQCCTARRATQRPALHCAKRCTAQSVAQCAAFYTPPSRAAQRAALHSAPHYTAPSTASQDKADRSKRTKHIQVVEYFSQRSTAAALKRYASV